MCRTFILVLIGIFCYGPPNISVAQTRQTDSPEVLKALLAFPAPPPHHAVTPNTEQKRERPPDFFAKNNQPPDDAPIEDIVDYWTRWAIYGDPPNVTDAVRKRLFDFCLSEPQSLPQFLRLVPQTDNTRAKIKELYDGAQNNERLDQEWRKNIKDWLLYNSTYFLDELLAIAHKAKDDDKDGEVNREAALAALATLDWSSAEPLLRGLLVSGQPRSGALALALFYQRAIDEKDMSGEERYRRDLTAIASNRSQPAYARNTAIQALSANEWSGRDEWYLGLFQDETLLELGEGSHTFSPLTSLFNSDPEKWIPIIARLLESKDINVRSAAALCLMTFKGDDARKDALLPLLPWLSNPAWVKDTSNQRLRLIQSLGNIDLPESVPGLISIIESDHGFDWMYAAMSLGRYKDPRAVPALKKALAKKKTESQRHTLIYGLLACHGLTETEQLQALEAYASKLTTEEGRAEMMRHSAPPGEEPPPVQLSIGRYFTTLTEAPESLVNAVLARAENLKTENPPLAKTLIEIVHEWESSNVDLDMIRRIANGSADANTISKALSRKPKFHESLLPELLALSAASGAAQGAGAVLLDDSGLAQGILTSRDQAAQIALLACSRLIQMPLPIELVGPFLRSKNSLLALAAEAYLLAEDSREARELLWQHHFNEAFVTGWRESFYYSDNNFDELNKIEKELRAEIFKENGPSEILALVGGYENSRIVLRLYPDKTVFTQYEDQTRYRERTVSKGELSAFKDFLTTNGIADRGPSVDWCVHGCPPSEFLALTKEKGRRVYNQATFGGWMEIHQSFAALGAGAKTHYNFEKDIKGLEVLYAGGEVAVHDVSQQGSELRIFVVRPETDEEMDELQAAVQSDDDSSEERAKRRRRILQTDKTRFSWRVFANNQLGAITSQPNHYPKFDSSKFMVDEEDDEVDPGDSQIQVLTQDSIIIAQNFNGLWKQLAGTKPVRLTSEGSGYSNPIATPDGKWLVVSKVNTHGAEPNYIVRYNLQTGREFRIKLDPADQFDPIAFVASHNKVLLRRAKDGPEAYTIRSTGPDKPEYYLLDPSTGETRLVSGEFEPLRQRGRRSLQRTEKPDEFWAAIPDYGKNQTQVGRYNTRDFSFKAVMEVPQIIFNSLAMWVDANQAKVYLVYKGQLLRLPLQAAR